MVLRFRRTLSLVILGSSLAVASCAEGTKVDIPMAKEVGGTAAFGTASGGVKGKNNTNSSIALGGATTKSGGLAKSSGGVPSSLHGASGAGSLNPSGGSIGDWGTGGARVSTIASPASGLAIRLTQQIASAQETRTDFVLVNFGPAAVDLTLVKIRYYFTIDAWGTPVFEIDDARLLTSNLDLKSSLKSSVFPLEPAETTADRYYEVSFGSGSLGSTGEARVNSRLHEQTWGQMTVANDYSFVGLSGFTDRMTVYVAGQLVWGTEPGAPIEAPGTGGTSGVAGAANIAYGGTSSGGSGGASTGSPLGGTSAETTTDPIAASAGESGVAGQASYAGNAGAGLNPS